MFSNSFLSLLKRSEIVMVSTGAGISAESGVPTFRGTDGLWKNYKAEDLATPEAFARDPVQVWEWYDWRRQIIQKVKPNPGHFALAEMETLVERFFLFTQNIDGLHQMAGSKNVQELHGNIWRARCTKEQKTLTLSDTPLRQIPPVCECGNVLRPDVVWFGESLPETVIRFAMQVAARCHVFFCIGTSALVHPAASLAWIARENGATVVEVNPEDTPVTDIADETFRQRSGVLLPQLVQAWRQHG
jgi:NAD-dependent deacetylase